MYYFKGGPQHSLGPCDAPIRANYLTQELYYGDQYWHYGHFSRYLPQGSLRVWSELRNTTNGNGDPASLRLYLTFYICKAPPPEPLQFTSFVSSIDDSVVVVVLNLNDVDVTYELFDIKVVTPINMLIVSDLMRCSFREAELLK